MLWLIPLCAWAGVPISLPPGEAVHHWRAAFELAGLEPADTWSAATVRIRVTGSSWEIVAQAPDGRERSETVARPGTPVEREEIAFLAQSLVRDLGLAKTPGLRPKMLEPPSPPPPRTARPAEPPTSPTPAPTIPAPPPAPTPVPMPTPPIPEPPPVLAPIPVPAPASTPVTPAEPQLPPEIEPEPVLVNTDIDPFADQEPIERRTRAVALPGIFAGPAMGLRYRTKVLAGLEVGIVPFQKNRWTVEISGQMFFPAQIEYGGIDERRLMPIQVRLGARYRVLPTIEVSGGVGLAALHFRQQFWPIDTTWVPQAALGTNARLWKWKSLSGQARLTGVLDLTPVQIVDEFGVPSILSPVSGVFSIVISFSGFGDPSATLPTLKR